nr:hypothetical protein [Desulfobulbaceae bacterium]
MSVFDMFEKIKYQLLIKTVFSQNASGGAGSNGNGLGPKPSRCTFPVDSAQDN